MDRETLVAIAYFVAAVTFILGLKGLSGPKTAVLGNRIAAAGMLLALAATFFVLENVNWAVVVAGMAVGTAIGVYGARAVPMTAMPQMVALFNGAGGGSAAVVSILEFLHDTDPSTGHGFEGIGVPISILLALMIGAVSFSGSLVAFSKLQGVIDPRAYRYPFQRALTAIVFGGMLLAAILILWGVAFGTEVLPGQTLLWAALVLALIFGVTLVLPIGGADMPVVISLLNAYTGLAVAAAGFVLGNQLLIIAGTLVGASGTILTRLMSKAMNRSLGNVLFGAFGAAAAAGSAGRADDGRTSRTATPEDAAALLAYARQVVIVPGYGLAVAQAQHGVRELADLLQEKGATVKYAIHPVAGRMPGHMNVLLAEANVPYEQLVEMDDINPEFPRTDVALVIGANDVTNPAARADKSSPIYGMPILDVDKAENVLVVKRSMRPGFAGIDNELYLDPKTQMVFGDAKEVLTQLVAEVKKL
ncbi:MAG TPA: NAD(P)(+) transhydrogenase (Re/Si-specific) subunit beta [Candidatus Limnocylindria bacterium]|nr:NAD(P)(+) transhydrogenase (Re/Si-specific) subunit beta [Candidatus Limnocylindria bacterium]